MELTLEQLIQIAKDLQEQTEMVQAEIVRLQDLRKAG